MTRIPRVNQGNNLYRNLTPYKIEIYKPNQFTNLKDEKGTFFADGVEGDPVLFLPSEGTARIYQQTAYVGLKNDGVPFWEICYGDLEFPNNFVWGKNDILIVSLPTKTMVNARRHPLREYLVSPYGVVRSKENSSLVLGCQGLTY